MNRLASLMGNGGGIASETAGNVGQIARLKGMLLTRNAQDGNLVDNSETVYISSLALLKMLRHGRAGVPMEVMGLMLGEFVDDYTVKVVVSELMMSLFKLLFGPYLKRFPKYMFS